MSEHRFYTGEELLNLPIQNNKFLIKGLLWERDAVILAGKAKSGKSVFAQQMAFAMSCGEPFLSTYETKAGCTIYIQAEGKVNETRRRVVSMAQGVSWNKRNFHVLYAPGMAINTANGLGFLTGEIDTAIAEKGVPKPKLIILDPLYMCIVGDLCNQVDATNTCKSLRILADRYSCAILLIHHEHRPVRDRDKNIIYEGSGGIFGSYIWQAYPDYVLMFRKKQGRGKNELTCDIQRATEEEVVSKIDLTYLGPDPTMYEIESDVAPYIRKVEMAMGKKMPLTTQQISEKTGLAYQSVAQALGRLRKEKIIEVISNGAYPKQWRLK